MKKIIYHGPAFFAIILFFIQSLLYTYFQNQLGKLDSAIWIMFCGLIPALYLVFIHKNSDLQIQVKQSSPSNLIRYLLGVLYGLCTLVILFMYQNIWHENPLIMDEVGFSDIYPQVHVLVDRFLHGEPVYSNIEFAGYTLYPTYLPATWGPFIIAEWLSIDYRWLPVIVCLISILIYFNNLMKSVSTNWLSPVFGLLPFLGWMLYLHSFPKEAAYNLEPMIAGFYMLLFLSLLSESAWFKIIALMLCLLSRYSVVLWVPLYITVMFVTYPKKARFMLLTGVLILFIFYIFPFLLKDSTIFLNGYRYHDHAALQEWLKTPPEHLENGTGLALFFYRYGPGTISQKLELLQNTHLIVCLISVLLMTVYYLIKRPNVQSFLIGSLVIYITLFYSLIQIPYTYLFLTPLFLGALLPYVIFRQYSRRFPVR